MHGVSPARHNRLDGLGSRDRSPVSPPHVVVGEGMGRAGELGLGQGLERLFGQPQVLVAW